MQTLTTTRPKTPAQLAMLAAGRTGEELARYHGCSRDWAYRVLRGDVPAPDRFRRDLAKFLDRPAGELFPE